MPKPVHSDAYYEWRRLKREARWNRPIGSARERLRAWLDLLFVDHGILRLVHLNRHRVGKNLLRSAQPSPRDIARMAQQGLKTIVNLRGGRSHGAWQLERDAAERHGVTIVDFVLRSREAPDRESLLGLPAFFASLDYPVLAHCKSGADRAGLFAALYLLVVEGARVSEARRELSLLKGHFRYAKTGILDAFLEDYAENGEKHGKAFMDWVRDDYDPEQLQKSFRPKRLHSLVADTLLRRE
ncbi:MAG: sulfur transferase domain-containing protein [Beijerinckiaceae bacterium]|nr:sulfur transferase domain-containing protein [Beijerinckiaceae bacterium]MCZ8300523.1 sulfur transferase domain-containing protein [Beijerinckiaceae bacterium]